MAGQAANRLLGQALRAQTTYAPLISVAAYVQIRCAHQQSACSEHQCFQEHAITVSGRLVALLNRLHAP
jgi:hypothetical protein